MTELSEMAAMTPVAASSNGIPAATRAPNTPRSRTSVIGRDVVSAWRKSSLSRAFAARSSLAPPASAILAWLN
jgi:hypothetical protein